MAAQIIFGCLVFYFFYSGIVVMPMDFGVPEQLGTLAAPVALVAPLDPVEFPAGVHRQEPVDVVGRACIKCVAAGFARILYCTFIF